MKKEIQIPSQIDLHSIKKFLSSDDFEKLYRTTIIEENNNITHNIFEANIFSIDFNIIKEKLNFNLSVIIRRIDSTKKDTIKTDYIEFSKLTFNNKKDDIHYKSPIYIEIAPHRKQNLGNPTPFQRRRYVCDLSAITNLKELVTFESLNINNIDPNKKFFSNLLFESYNLFLNENLKAIVNANAVKTCKPIEYTIISFYTENLNYDLFENELIFSGTLRALKTSSGITCREFLTNYTINVKYDSSTSKSILKSISLEKAYYKTFNIDIINDLISKNKYALPFDLLSINEAKDLDESINYTKSRIDDLIIKEYQEQIRNEDPHGTGGNQPSSCIFD